MEGIRTKSRYRMHRGRSAAPARLLWVPMRSAARSLGLSEEALAEILSRLGKRQTHYLHIETVEEVARLIGIADVGGDTGEDDLAMPDWMATALRRVTDRHLDDVAWMRRRIEVLTRELAAARAKIVRLERGRHE